jgi:4-amino-4-deoxy-L-arabinose transferase-like glycosyltransferase
VARKKRKQSRRPDQTRDTTEDADAGHEEGEAVPVEARRSLEPEPDRAHVIRGGAVFGIGAITTLVLMMNDGQVAHGPLWGSLAMLAAAFGLIDMLGITSKAVEATPIRDTVFGVRAGEPPWSAPHYAVAVSLIALVGGAVAFGYEGLSWSILAALVALLPCALFRPGLLVFVVVAAIYLPLLGDYGLWDPWETHYGEVAREMLARDDWISLWWAQENWFWSKPILIFWTEALSLGAFGVDFMPDANPAHPEWAIRLPVLVMSMGAVMAVYAAVRKIWSPRAGVLSALVLASMPHFFFLSHQAITDIPFVANVTVAMCLLALALAEDPAREVRSYRIGPVVLSGRHVLVMAIFVIVAPQVLYLISRNITIVGWSGFAWHGDEFMFGSAGNLGVPGNATPYDATPAIDALWAQPVVQGFVWAVGLFWVLFFVVRERRAQSLYMFGFYVFCGLAFMGKGIPGFALPGAVALFFLIGSGRWSLLLEGRLRIAAGVLTLTVVGLPWYVAMYVRHGPPFTDRLLIHDHINRLASGVHGDNGSIEYFLEQLGVATFPWVAFAPVALTMFLWYARRRDAAASSVEDHRRDTAIMVGLWFVTAFVLFSAMVTKFHHYIFPVVPPMGIMVGVLLDRLFGWSGDERRRERAVATVLALAAPLPLVAGVAGLWGDVRGIIPEDVPAEERAEWVMHNGWSPTVCIALVALGVIMLGAAWWLGRDRSRQPEDDRWLVPSAVVLGSGAVLLALVGRDLSWVTDARPQGYERLIQLFIYNYGRPWPDHFDYRPVLTAFSLVATTAAVVAMARAFRPVALRAFLGVALLFSAWTLNVYMIDLSPHWGQREIVKAYFEERNDPSEPLVAWQMNWKGENFYSGNHVSVFVDLDNQKIRQWIEQHSGRRVFVLLEHARLNSFRGLVRGQEIREVTDKRLCNKFLLIEVTL